MPTAVITESSEKMISSKTICSRTPLMVAAGALAPPSTPSSFWWISCVLLAIRKSPPRTRMMSFPRFLRQNREQGLGQPHDPREREKKEYPREHRRARPQVLPCLPVGREFPGQDGDEDDIVDAENNLQRCQGARATHDSGWVIQSTQPPVYSCMTVR